jgi:hypothetical protein
VEALKAHQAYLDGAEARAERASQERVAKMAAVEARLQEGEEAIEEKAAAEKAAVKERAISTFQLKGVSEVAPNIYRFQVSIAGQKTVFAKIGDVFLGEWKIVKFDAARKVLTIKRGDLEVDLVSSRSR